MNRRIMLFLFERIGVRRVGRFAHSRPRSECPAQPLLLLPVSLFPTQLLAQHGSAVAGAARHAPDVAPRLHGVSAFPRAAVAL